MTLAALFVYLFLALLTSSSPLQLVAPQLLSTTEPPLDLSTLTGKSNCFIQAHHPGARHLFETSSQDCRGALTLMLFGRLPNTPYSFSRDPSADVRLPYAKAHRTCKIIIDITEATETEKLTWQEIGDTLKAPRGVLSVCLGQGGAVPLEGRMTVREKKVMQVLVVGQAWKSE